MFVAQVNNLLLCKITTKISLIYSEKDVIYTSMW